MTRYTVVGWTDGVLRVDYVEADSADLNARRTNLDAIAVAFEGWHPDVITGMGPGDDALDEKDFEQTGQWSSPLASPELIDAILSGELANNDEPARRICPSCGRLVEAVDQGHGLRYVEHTERAGANVGFYCTKSNALVQPL